MFHSPDMRESVFVGIIGQAQAFIEILRAPISDPAPHMENTAIRIP